MAAGARRMAFTKCCSLLAAALVAGCAPAAADYRWDEHALGSGASLRGISALSRDVIWASGSEGAVYKTENRGRTWEKVVIPDTEHLDFRDVEVLSKDIVVIMSAGEGNRSSIFRTADGGASWDEVFANASEEGFYDGLAFWDGKQGILGGDPVAGEMFFAKTVDGGESWQRIDPDLLPPLNEAETGGFAASGSHLAVRGNSVWISSVFAGSRISFSRDRGVTWSVVSTPIVQHERTQGIFSLAFFDEMTGVAVGGDFAREADGADNVILTDDGGLTWRFARNFPVFQSSVRYLSRDNLVSVGPAAGYYSDDGGERWQQIDGNGYHSLSVAADGSVWAAGQGGRVASLVASSR
jgi:photosystem II stability/assembly factor-like uncharacterized protein